MPKKNTWNVPMIASMSADLLDTVRKSVRLKVPCGAITGS